MPDPVSPFCLGVPWAHMECDNTPTADGLCELCVKAYKEAEKKVLTPDPPPAPDAHLVTLHQTIAGLLAQADALGKHAEAFGRLVQRSRFNARPVDLGPAVAESLVGLLQSVGALSRVQAIVLSELLSIRGMDSGMKYELTKASEPGSESGNGDRPGPALVTP